MRMIREVETIKITLPASSDPEMMVLTQVWASLTRVHVAYRFREADITVVLRNADGHDDPEVDVDGYKDSADVAEVKNIIDDAYVEALADLDIHLAGDDVPVEADRMRIIRDSGDKAEGVSVVVAKVPGKEFS